MAAHGAASGSEWDGARYDRVADPHYRWGRAVLDRVALSGDETVLDAGCGSGRVTEALLERVPAGRVVALDASASMLGQARVRLAAAGDRVRFVHADLRGLGPETLGADAPVDVVFSTATFHWVLDHGRLFADLASVIRPGGQLVAQCGGAGNLEGLLAAVRSLGAERAGAWHYAAPAPTADRLRQAGFVAVDVWAEPEPTPFVDEAELADFLETVCLRAHLATLPTGERRSFAERVAAALPGGVIDYVRLNIVARRAG